MAVQKSRRTPSTRGMRRSHDSLSAKQLSTDVTTGETHIRHHVTKDGSIADRALVKMDKNNWAPRFGFNYRFGKASGPLGFLLGEGLIDRAHAAGPTADLTGNVVEVAGPLLREAGAV